MKSACQLWCLWRWWRPFPPTVLMLAFCGVVLYVAAVATPLPSVVSVTGLVNP